MRCDQCQFWEPPEGSEYDGWTRLFGRCDRTPHSEDVGAWDYDEEGDLKWLMASEFADRTAVASDGSGYAASLNTKPEHFCAMFQKKEAA